MLHNFSIFLTVPATLGIPPSAVSYPASRRVSPSIYSQIPVPLPSPPSPPTCKKRWNIWRPVGIPSLTAYELSVFSFCLLRTDFAATFLEEWRMSRDSFTYHTPWFFLILYVKEFFLRVVLERVYWAKFYYSSLFYFGIKISPHPSPESWKEVAFPTTPQLGLFLLFESIWHDLKKCKQWMWILPPSLDL